MTRALHIIYYSINVENIATIIIEARHSFALISPLLIFFYIANQLFNLLFGTHNCQKCGKKLM